MNPELKSRFLDHTIQGIGQVTHVYARYDFLEEKREALDLWGSHLSSLLNASSVHPEGREQPPQPRRHPSGVRAAAPAWRQSSLLDLDDA